MAKIALNLLVILILCIGFQACELYDAAFKDTKKTETSSSSSNESTTISVTPTGDSFATAGSKVFTATGGTGSYSWSKSGETNNFSGLNFESTTSTTATVTFIIPTALEDRQQITIIATDGQGATGSATLTLEPATT